MSVRGQAGLNLKKVVREPQTTQKDAGSGRNNLFSSLEMHKEESSVTGKQESNTYDSRGFVQQSSTIGQIKMHIRGKGAESGQYEEDLD